MKTYLMYNHFIFCIVLSCFFMAAKQACFAYNKEEVLRRIDMQKTMLNTLNCMFLAYTQGNGLGYNEELLIACKEGDIEHYLTGEITSCEERLDELESCLQEIDT